MLVLARREGQSIIIGKEFITIKVIEVSGKSVRFGIEAPKDISIHREEIYDKIAGGIEPQPRNPRALEKEPVTRTISELSLHDVAQRFNGF